MVLCCHLVDLYGTAASSPVWRCPRRHASETRVIVGLQSVTGAEKYKYKTRKPEESGQSQGISSAAVVYEKGGPGLLPATAV